MLIIGGCLLAQWIAALLAPSAWWTPDLLLIGMILAIRARPSRWMAYALAAALSQLAWAVRPWPLLLSHLVVAGFVSLAFTRWDPNDRRLQLMVVGIAGAVPLGVMLWVEALWSLPLLGCAAWRLSLTVMCFPLLRRLVSTPVF